MKKILVFGILGFMILSMMAYSGYVSAGSVSKDKVYIPYVNFDLKDITYDGKADESGFFTFSITTNNGKIIDVAWRQNGVDLHVVLTSTNPGWLAVGWQNKTPSSTTGAGPMVDANIITGGNNVSRDDTGSYGAHDADTTNNIINSFSVANSTGAKFEFTFPLQSPDPVDQALTAKSWGYFIFATGTSANIDDGHGGTQQAWYLPNVYIESSSQEGYKAPSGGGSTPFSSPAVILISLSFIAIFTKLKRKNN